MAEFVKNNKKTNNKNFDREKNFKKPYNKKPVQQTTQNRIPQGIEVPEFAGVLLEYKMSTPLAQMLIKADKSKRSHQEILCEYVNTHCGLKGYCVRVSYF